MAMSEEDVEPLLVEPKTKYPPEEEQGPARFAPHKRASHFLILHALLIFLYTLFTIIVITRLRNTSSCSHGPLKDLNIRFKPRKFINLTDNNPYTGPPSQQVDAAWETLLGNMNLRVSSKELAQDDQHSVALPEGGGHLAWLGAVHELHCVKMLREWKYRDHYHPNLSEADAEYTHWDSHADHCIDLLRQTALCHASDPSLTTFVWDASSPKPMFYAGPATHTCVDWEGLMASPEMRKRRVGSGEMGRLRNPLLLER